MSLQYYIPTLTEQLANLHKIITQMQTDLTQYEQKNGQNKYSYFKQQQVKILLTVYNEIDTLTDLLLKDTSFNNDEKILKLEGVCLLHGISDLPYYLACEKTQIINQVQQAHTEGWRQMPFDLQTLENQKINPNQVKYATKPTLNWQNILKKN